MLTEIFILKNKSLKLIALSLCAALFLSLSSCITVNSPVKQETMAADTETESDSAETTDYDYYIVENNFIRERDRYLNIIGSEDYNGAAFMVATPTPSLIEPDNTPTAMSKFAYDRRQELEARYNIRLSCKNVAADAMYEEVRAACLANDFYADMLMIPQYMVHMYITSGSLMNMNSLPFADFESGYNIESGVSAGSALNATYALGAWISLDFGSLPAVFFNKDLIAATGLEDPYDLVRRGEWTWDKFHEYVGAIPSLNEKLASESLPAVSSYGIRNDPDSLSDMVYFSEGNVFVAAGQKQYPSIATNTDGAYHALENAKILLSDPMKVAPENAVSSFSDGKSLFLIDRLDTMNTIKSSDAVWGVLPLPKGSAEQKEYCSLVPCGSLMAAVPANSTGAEKVSRILSALDAYSLGYVQDAYLTDCMNYSLRDNDSIRSVELICYGAVWDMAYTVGGGDVSVQNATYAGFRSAAAGAQDLGYYFDMYSGGATGAITRLFS